MNLRHFSLLIITLIGSSFISHGQIGEKIKTEVLAKVRQKVKPILKEEYSSISFSAMQTTDLINLKTSNYIVLDIESSETKNLYRTIGISYNDLLGTGINSSVSKKTETEKGSIILIEEDISLIKEFMNETIKLHSQYLKNTTTLSMTMNERLTIAIIYDKAYSIKENAWKYLFKLDEAVFEMTYLEGLNLIRKVLEFQKHFSTKKPKQ